MAENGDAEESEAGPAERPGFFEVVSADSLRSGLKPAALHVVKWLNNRYPTPNFRYVIKFFDEIYAAFEILLEHSYLTKYGATFTEYFYGLTRITNRDDTPLRNADKRRSLMLVVLIPYLREKLDKLCRQWKEQLETNTFFTKNSRACQIAAAFVWAWPMIASSLDTINFVLQLAYLAKNSNRHSLWLILAGVRLTYLADGAAESGALGRGRPIGFLRRLIEFIKRSIGRLFIMAVYLLQFLDWWSQSEHKGKSIQQLFNEVPIPKPPQMAYSEEYILKLDPGLCPLCKRQRKNDTVLSVSGYVFCYSCIFKFVTENRSCPVTCLPASTRNLIKLYVQAA